MLIFLTLLTVSSCANYRVKLPDPPPPPPPAPKDPAGDFRDVKKQSYRNRAPITKRMSRYEGSLWEDESSWGNLLRDHRARFKNDVITITNLAEIISVPPKEDQPKLPTKSPLALAGGNDEKALKIAKVLEALNEAVGAAETAEEQNDVLRSLKTISARVTSVLPNGNMVIVGEKVDYRQQNSVRYVTMISGIIRPEDVSDKNEITALRLARSEVKIKRQVTSKGLRPKALSPIIGKNKAGLLDQLNKMTVDPKDNKTSTVNTQ